MSSLPKFKRLSVDDYLERERDSRIRHEYVEGELFAMAGASRAHNTISLNLAAAFRAHLQGTPCRAYMADMKVRVSARRFYYPDVLVSCQAALEAEDEYYETKPKLIVEVFSAAPSVPTGARSESRTRVSPAWKNMCWWIRTSPLSRSTGAWVMIG
ncbi:MAG: Uma2 family endonuclease [Gammaproteobacteria bacterium]